METTTRSLIPLPVTLEVGRRFNWKVYGVIIGGCVFGFVALLPYVLTLQAKQLAVAELSIPLPLLLVIQGLQNVVLLAIVGGLGYMLATRIGLGLPFIEGWIDGKPIWEKLPRVALVAAVTGGVVSALIVALDAGYFGPAMAGLVNASGGSADIPTPPAWQGLLASFYGGIDEEVLLRLGMLTFFAWIGRFVGRTGDNRPNLAVLWFANILAAVLFGLGHLPATAQLGFPMVPVVIARAVVLNGMLGILAGWLYWRYGLESAMIAHFSGDIVLHVIPPLLVGAIF